MEGVYEQANHLQQRGGQTNSESTQGHSETSDKGALGSRLQGKSKSVMWEVLSLVNQTDSF